MSAEVEIKIRDINKSEIIQKIEKLGAKKTFCGKVFDSRFDTFDRELSRQGKALRIRKKGKLSYLETKGKKKMEGNIVNRDEKTIRVANFRGMQKILNELGYIKIFELEKIRTQYVLDDITFDIDEYVGVEPMLEIEGKSYEVVQKYLKKLEIDQENAGRIYIREIIAARKYYRTFSKDNEENPEF